MMATSGRTGRLSDVSNTNSVIVYSYALRYKKSISTTIRLNYLSVADRFGAMEVPCGTNASSFCITG
jgi:hypothetical protein